MLESQEKEQTGALDLQAHSPVEDIDMSQIATNNRSTKSADILLHEVGGNISEHRLDPDAHLLDLYRTNPHGEWGSSNRTPPKPLDSKEQPGCHIPAATGWVYSATCLTLQGDDDDGDENECDGDVGDHHGDGDGDDGDAGTSAAAADSSDDDNDDGDADDSDDTESFINLIFTIIQCFSLSEDVMTAANGH
ncbi:hypothetical protein J1605_015830 [Eschrichtius robustus]|uniref:RHG40/28/18 C-terminal ubiquitin-like domain-containing protein n=1 Tax=Eschrichtius robustus TaxID=9764 RepID=A0AB34GCR7_ESCRO|nr:hypothetical protein J1605_015830 [Eschrichtius robustus]